VGEYYQSHERKEYREMALRQQESYEELKRQLGNEAGVLRRLGDIHVLVCGLGLETTTGTSSATSSPVMMVARLQKEK